MKIRICTAVLVVFFGLSCNGQENNDFYDNTPARILAGAMKIEVTGEVANPGPVLLSRLPRRSLIVREAVLREGQVSFVGAYRYDGYSLFDILKEKYAAKKNKGEFNSVIDLLVVVENGKGEKAVLSWGEIFYPNSLHRILIAARVAPVIPSKTGEKWPLPERTKLVCGNDLISGRNIAEPLKITVVSAPLSFKTSKGLQPLYAPDFTLFSKNGEKVSLPPPQVAPERRVYPSVFYGRGMGFHGVNRFAGVLFREVLAGAFPVAADKLKCGYFVMAGADGYRIAVTFSELFNRNDQAEFLLIDHGENADGGRFSIYPAADFFSDRAVKAIAEIHYLEVD